MSRDPLATKRDAFVITGGLLAFYALLALVYSQWYRVPDPQCAQGELLVAGCVPGMLVLGPFIVVGIAIAAFGGARYRSPPEGLEGHLHHGTGVHFLVAFEASLVIFSALGYAYTVLQERALPSGEYIAIVVQGTPYLLSFVLQLMLLGSILMFVTTLAVVLAQAAMRRRFIEAAQEVAAQGQDEDASYGYDEGEEGYVYEDKEGLPHAASKDIEAFDESAQGSSRIGALAEGDEPESREDPDRWDKAFGERQGRAESRAHLPHMPLEHGGTADPGASEAGVAGDGPTEPGRTGPGDPTTGDDRGHGVPGGGAAGWDQEDDERDLARELERAGTPTPIPETVGQDLEEE